MELVGSRGAGTGATIVDRTMPVLREPPLPRSLNGVDWQRPDGTLWARNRSSDAAGAKVRLCHVDQGYLGDCFLEAVLGALALKRPTVLANLVTMRPNAVEVHLPAGETVVSRALPMQHGRLVFAGSGTNNVLWPAYVEKALAATHRGGYRFLDGGGEPAEAFGWVTGQRPRQLRAAPGGSVVDAIAPLLHDGHPVVVATRGSHRGIAARAAMDRVGLYDDHCYVVTAADARAGAQTLRLWNPWGMSQPQVVDAATAALVLDRVTADTVTWALPRPR